MVLEVVVAQLSGLFENTCVCARPDWPTSCEGAYKIENTVAVVAEDANSEEFTEGCACYGKRAICEVVLVAQEVDPVYKEGKDNRFVSCALNRVVLVLEGPDECVRKVGGCELGVDEDDVEKQGAQRTASKVSGVSAYTVGQQLEQKKKETDRYSAVNGLCR